MLLHILVAMFKLATSKTKGVFWSSKPISALIHLARWQLGVRQDCCKWQGISCNADTRRVIGLSLPVFISNGDFLGETTMENLLSPSITLLISLQVLDLSELLGLSGCIPPLIGFDLPDLQKLYLQATCELVLFLKALVISQS